MTLPQDRQLGAAPCKGWRVATQLHFRALGLSSVGFVVISNARMAASKSEMAVDCPAIGVPPVTVIFVLPPDVVGFGVELREDWLDLDFLDFSRESETRNPADGRAGTGCGFGVLERDASLLVGALNR
jgi:hypothetical protein